MYRAALCEDEQVFAVLHEKTCRVIFDRLHIQFQINVFTDSASFLRSFTEEGARYDLILLDIIMDGVNGMELARTIREADADAAIIFVTSTNHYLAQGYDVQALHYLKKPVDEHKLEELIARDYKKRTQNDFYVFDSGGAKRRVKLGDIVCLETVGRRVEVTLADGSTLSHSDKLSRLLSALPDRRFIRCHQAFAVNLDLVRELDGGAAIATNGKQIPVSRAYAKEIKRAFLERFRVN